jgi:hypothetical protein
MIKRFFASLALAFVLAVGSSVTLVASDISITAANVVPSSAARYSQQLAGVAITAGQVVYFDTTTGTVKLAKANLAPPGNSVFGIAMSNASANQPVVVCTYDPALAIGGTIAAGTLSWLSVVNAGGISSTGADDVSGGTMTRIFIGVGTGSNKINFSPVAGGAVP